MDVQRTCPAHTRYGNLSATRENLLVQTHVAFRIDYTFIFAPPQNCREDAQENCAAKHQGRVFYKYSIGSMGESLSLSRFLAYARLFHRSTLVPPHIFDPSKKIRCHCTAYTGFATSCRGRQIGMQLVV